jgi:hypothetical protein
MSIPALQWTGHATGGLTRHRGSLRAGWPLRLVFGEGE